MSSSPTTIGSSAFQCTPSATDPVDYNCPVADQGIPQTARPRRPDERGGRGLRGRLGEGRPASPSSWHSTPSGRAPRRPPPTSPSPTAPAVSPTRAAPTPIRARSSIPSYPNDQGLVNAFLNAPTAQSRIRQISTGSPTPGRTCSWVAACSSPCRSTPFRPGRADRSPPGTYSYEITAATAYGESEPSTPQSVSVALTVRSP